jgi:tRNA(fMet)-specific endonuclease VapC
MKWMLDTNACIRYLNGRSPQLRAKFATADPQEICDSTIAKAELYFGAAMTRDPAATRAAQQLFLSRFASLPFDDAAAEAYGEIRADLTRKGELIGPNDLLIAAICRANHLALVTHNVSEFGRVEGLVIDDWES